MTNEKGKNKVEEPVVEYGKKYTYNDYVNSGIDYAFEFIRGEILKMYPGAGTSHQDVHRNLFGEIYKLLEDHPCKLYGAPYDIILPVKNETRNTATTVVQPDLCIICNPDLIDERGCFGAPDLIVEIVSPAANGLKRDVQMKYSIYEEAGVKEYWIAFPKLKTIEVFVLENKKYQSKGKYQNGTVISSIVLPNIQLNLSSIFKD